ncbi:DUF4350 domain-containing protein, partial [Kitasatospora sp. LaBMicrA B282]
DPAALLAAVGDRLAADRLPTAAAGPADRAPADRAPADLPGLLYGPAPTDDAALLRLADDLDALERQVRQP